MQAKKPRIIGEFATAKEARAAGFDPVLFRVAGVHETLGPHFKDILLVNRTPYTYKTA